MNYFNKHSFLFLLGGGATVSCVVRLLFDAPLYGSIVAILVCLICLIAYYMIVKQDNTGLHNPDNCYYMGLLFTLVSLIYSLLTLFFFNSDVGDVAGRTYNLIGSFGIALISTFVGILFRILLLQKLPKPPPDDDANESINALRHQVHADLIETAFRLRQELTQTIADMSVFRNALVQAANETVIKAGKAQTAMTQQMQKSADEQTETLSKLSTAATVILTKIVDESTASAKEMNKAGAAMTRQVEEAADKQIEILSMMSSATVAKFTEVIGEITASVSNLKKPLGDLVNSQAEQVRSLHESSVKISRGGDDLVASIASVQEPLKDIVRNLQSTDQDIQTIFSDHDSLNSKLQETAKLFTQIEETMKQSANSLSVATEEFSRSLAKTTEVTPQYAGQFQEMIIALRGEVEQWQAMTKEVRTSLTQAVEELTKAIKGSS